MTRPPSSSGGASGHTARILEALSFRQHRENGLRDTTGALGCAYKSSMRF